MDKFVRSFMKFEPALYLSSEWGLIGCSERWNRIVKAFIIKRQMHLISFSTLPRQPHQLRSAKQDNPLVFWIVDGTMHDMEHWTMQSNNLLSLLLHKVN